MIGIEPRRGARQRLGARGENTALRLLELHGCELLARNWRCRAGELDLVVRDGLLIRFVEVKSRRCGRWNRKPFENLSFHQRQRNFRAARLYRRLCRLENFECRFDLIEVEFRTMRRISAVRWRHDYLPELPPEEPPCSTGC